MPDTYVAWLALVGAVLLGVCAIPQAVRSWRTKRADDVSWWFLSAWFFGDIALLLYGIETGLPLPIVLNNVVNAICIVVISWFK